MYRGVPGLNDFGPGREMPEDSSDMEHQLFWSTCRPHQVRLPWRILCFTQPYIRITVEVLRYEAFS